MKIHVWNAFASNNSGSYTIVGSFETEELAAQVAAELKEVLTAHGEWSEAETRSREPGPRPSPLDVFVQKHGLTGSEDLGGYDDWPQYAGNNVPEAWAIGHQVFVHHGYTVTLPRTLGEFIYARGGRVRTELNHAHHPVVSVFELWPQKWDQKRREDLAAVLVEQLHADEGPLVEGVAPYVLPAWKAGGGRFAEPVLTIGAVFEDLPKGFTAVDRLARSHGLRPSIKLFEAWSAADPLTFLRPCDPPLKRELFDVWLLGLGSTPEAVEELLPDKWSMLGGESYESKVPVAVWRRRPAPQAEALAKSLREAGASVELRPAPAT